MDVSATGRALVRRSPAECGVSEYGLATSTMKRPGPLGLSKHEKGKQSVKEAEMWVTGTVAIYLTVNQLV